MNKTIFPSNESINARILATELAKIPGIAIDPEKIETNIVIFEPSGDAAEISRELMKRGVMINPINDGKMRAVTHYDVDRAGCETAAGAIREVMQGRSAKAAAR